MRPVWPTENRWKKDEQTGESDEEVKGQCHHAAQIVQVEQTAHGVFVGAKQKELSQQFSVNDNAADQQRHHGQAGNAQQKYPTLFQAILNL